MEKDPIFYLFTTWHASIFDSLCFILRAESVNFGMFRGVVHPHVRIFFQYYFRF